MAERAEQDAGVCGETHESIDGGAPCKYLAGHLDAGIPHMTANGFWWSPTSVTPPADGDPSCMTSPTAGPERDGESADYDAPFSWDVFPGSDGLPTHLPIGVTAEGQGPTRDDEAHHWLCWCGKPDCLLTAALRKAWESGTRVTPPAVPAVLTDPESAQ